MRRSAIVFGLTLALLAVGCGESPARGGGDSLVGSAKPDRDSQPGGLYHDFLRQGKYDSAGHPQGATVFEGERGCSPATGEVADGSIGAKADRDDAGVICQNTTGSLGDGTFTLSARAAMPESAVASHDADEPVLEIGVLDDGSQIASRTVTGTDFGEGGVEQNFAENFRHRGDGAVDFEVKWKGSASLSLRYVELFRSTPRLVLSPHSKALDFEAQPTFEIEMQDPPDDLSFEIECDGTDITDVLTQMLESGEAERTETEFRAIVSAPAQTLFESCTLPARIKVHALAGEWTRETSRVTYLAEPIPCSFMSDGNGADSTRVLVSGFEPFPADSRRDNSSEEAVEAYASGEHPEELDVMKTVLPVEYDAAAELLEDVVERCEPDVVIGFGQGRSEVDVERIAYNRKDTAAIAGGVPDNRGVVFGGAPIVEGGPSERETELPVDTILAKLDNLDIDAGPSDDPGRYVCNNLFYSILRNTASDPTRTGGFVHLPRIPTVGDAERETLRQTVATVVESTLAARE